MAKNKIKKAFNKGKASIKDVKTYWKNPKEGNYISFKEYTSLVLGASGLNSVTMILTHITFTVGCFLIGSIYGIKFRDLNVIAVIGIPFTFLWTFLGMPIQDNLGVLPTKTKKLFYGVTIPLFILGIVMLFLPHTIGETLVPGFLQIMGGNIIGNIIVMYFRIGIFRLFAKRFGKFRPWIFASMIPLLIVVALIVYLPFKEMVYHTRLWKLNILFVLYAFLSTYPSNLQNIQNVISPNGEERVKTMSTAAFFYSLIPSLVGLLLPIFADLAGGFDNIKTFRIVLPLFLVLLSPLGLFVFFGTKERVHVSKNHKPSIGFIKGAKEVFRNKYQWIHNLSNIPTLITMGSIAVVNLMFVYSLRKDWLLGVFWIIVGNAAVPGLLLANFLIKKFGKKKIRIFSLLFSALSSILLYFTIRLNNAVLFIIVSYLTALFATPAGIAAQSMNAEIWDYQQYISGERMDGYSSIFTLISVPIAALVSLFIPMVYSRVGFSSDWKILYDPKIRMKVAVISLSITLIAGVLSAIPIFFYDLTTQKHEEIIKILKKRADDEDGISDESECLENNTDNIPQDNVDNKN